jgi:hypothetical protein
MILETLGTSTVETTGLNGQPVSRGRKSGEITGTCTEKFTNMYICIDVKVCRFNIDRDMH